MLVRASRVAVSIASRQAGRLLVGGGRERPLTRRLVRGLGRVAAASKGTRGIVHQALDPHQRIGSALGENRRATAGCRVGRGLLLLDFGRDLARRRRALRAEPGDGLELGSLVGIGQYTTTGTG